MIPSLAEGFGIALVEAMASGCACIVSDLPVLKDVAGDTALYFDPYKPEQLAERIEQLVNNSELRSKLAKKACARVQNRFGMKKFIVNYKQLYASQYSNGSNVDRIESNRDYD